MNLHAIMRKLIQVTTVASKDTKDLRGLRDTKDPRDPKTMEEAAAGDFKVIKPKEHIPERNMLFLF
jgi:hypothetical protein